MNLFIIIIYTFNTLICPGSQVSVPENQNSVLPDHDASNDGDAGKRERVFIKLIMNLNSHSGTICHTIYS